MGGTGTGTPATASTVSISHGYCTLDQLKTWLMPTLAGTDSSLDEALSVAINAASRAIDKRTGRRFWGNSADETRYVTASDESMLLERDLGIDIISLTSLATDEDGDRTYERSWTTSDYDLRPDNAALESKPYTRVAMAPMGSYSFPVGITKGVKLVGVFGYCTSGNQDVAVSELRGLCLIQAARYYQRTVTPMGVAGGAFGESRITDELDPDVALALQHLMRDLAG
jgi:hypothetical protein